MEAIKISKEEKESILLELANWLGRKCMARQIRFEDARDVTMLAVRELIMNWDSINAPNGLASYQSWLWTVATREFSKMVKKEKRDRTTSLDETLPGGAPDDSQTLGASLTDPHSPSFEELKTVRTDDVKWVRAVLKEMPKRCQMKEEMCGTECAANSNCTILWNRYGRKEEKVTIEQLAEEFGLTQNKFYARYQKCIASFRQLHERKP